MSFLSRVMVQPANLNRILNHPLNRNRKLNALYRWVAWQVRSRSARDDVAVPFANGLTVYGRSGMTGAASTAYVGLNEFDDMALVVHALRPGDLFLDVGANLGLYSLLAAGAAGAHVIAYEPMPATSALLKSNVHRNGLDGLVSVVTEAVGREQGSVELTSTGNDVTSRVATDREDADQRSLMTTLDASVGSRTPTFLKVDVEGFEGAVLEGAANILAHPTLQFALIEVNTNAERYGYSGQWIVDTMARFGMKPFRYDAGSRLLTPLQGANAESDNTLFIKDVEAAVRRVADGQQVSVLGSLI